MFTNEDIAIIIQEGKAASIIVEPEMFACAGMCFKLKEFLPLDPARK